MSRLSKDTRLDEFDQTLIDTIRNEQPETLEESIKLVRSRFPESDRSIMERVLRLESEGKILFERGSALIIQPSLRVYFFSGGTIWFWVVLSFAVVASVMVFVIPEDVFPLAYSRYLFGSVFVLFLPGYSLVKVLFSRKELDSIECVAMSIGLSLALVPLAGLLLNYTALGIRTIPVTLCLFALTAVFASVAVVRDYRTLRKMTEV